MGEIEQTNLSSLPFAEECDWKFLFQGAESRVYRSQYRSQPAILKERFKKHYRLAELDQKLTKERIRAEMKAYEKISKKCKELSEVMPNILYSDERHIIFAEIENACNVSRYFNQNEDSPELVDKMMRELGKVVANIHLCGIVHGDLTTSNFLVKTLANSTHLIPIDFGLSSSSQSDEDRAVDLYVLERAIQSTHPKLDFSGFLEAYREKMNTDKINKRLDQVRMRGRKRLMIG